MICKLDEYMVALSAVRGQGALPEENYWFYVNLSTGEVKFKAREKKEDGWIGYFVEDDGRLPQIASLAAKKVRRPR